VLARTQTAGYGLLSLIFAPVSLAIGFMHVSIDINSPLPYSPVAKGYTVWLELG